MTVHSVSDVTRYIKSMFEGEAILSDILIRGELSNFKRYPSGHCYFTLKDAAASMKCVMFNGYARNLRFTPENGMQVIVGGNISVYERDGAYQLYATSINVEGAGMLALAFEQLKEKREKKQRNISAETAGVEKKKIINKRNTSTKSARKVRIVKKDGAE